MTLAEMYARQAGRYSGSIKLALVAMRGGDYAAAHAELEKAELQIRNDDLLGGSPSIGRTTESEGPVIALFTQKGVSREGSPQRGPRKGGG